jgi:hypothetical protein
VQFFGHLLTTDAISWGTLSNIVLTEEATTSSARIFIKILFQVRPLSQASACRASSPESCSLARWAHSHINHSLVVVLKLQPHL